MEIQANSTLLGIPIGFLLQLMVMALPIIVFAVLVVLLVRVLKRASAAPPPRPPGASRAERVEDYRQRREAFVEERSRLLTLTDTGKVSPEEADQLLDALERKTLAMSCPYCAEEIHVNAVKCKHCKAHLLEEPGRPQLTLSKDRVISGVCGGLAEWGNIDPALVRVVVAVAAFFFGFIPGIIIYAIAVCILPDS